VTWADKYEAQLRAQRAAQQSAANMESMERARVEQCEQVVTTAFRRIESNIVAPFLRAADTPQGRSVGHPDVVQMQGKWNRWTKKYRMITVQDRGLVWRMSGHNMRVAIWSRGYWEYAPTRTYNGGDGSFGPGGWLTRDTHAVGRDSAGWWSTSLHTNNTVEGKARALNDIADELNRMIPVGTSYPIRPEALQGQANALIATMEDLVIAFMAGHRIEPR
jgi:hypothetical protein